MKLGIMQPYFYPYIGYWQLLNLVDEYVIYDDVNYIKKGWINRNYILLNGQPHRINICIKDASQNRLIKDTGMSQTKEDTRKLLTTISQGYRKAPYFNEVYYILEEALRCEETCLADYLMCQIKAVKDYLGIKTKLILSSKIEKDNNLKGEAKIIDICKRRKADCYINAIGGKQLYKQDNFEKYGLQLKFLETNNITYHQFEEHFVPQLSIIDVLMFNSVEEVRNLLDKYILREY